MKDFRTWTKIREAKEETPKLKTGVEKIFYIMRGLPGSGKSYTAQQLLVKHGGNLEGHIFTTDNQYIPETRSLRRKGEYVSPQQEKEEYTQNYKTISSDKAHKNNLTEFKLAVDQGVTPIILDNTNIKKEQARVYAEYAEKAGYDIRIKESDSPWWQQNRNFLADKKQNATQLGDFLKDLHKRQSHGVPMNAMKDMMAAWQHNINVEDILGRERTKLESCYAFKPSEVHGNGVIATKFIPKGTCLGTTHKKHESRWEMLKPLGNYNHSSTQVNAVIMKQPTHKEMVSIKDLYPGDEIFVDFRGQPDLEQPQQGWSE